MTRHLHKALKDAKLDETDAFHHLRHTFGTTMAAAGVAMRTLQEWMGHRHLSTTERYADYAPRSGEAELVTAAFAASHGSNGRRRARGRGFLRRGGRRGAAAARGRNHGQGKIHQPA